MFPALKSITDVHLERNFRRISLVLGTTVTFVGFTVLMGWLFHIPAFKSIYPDWVSMKANTAICLILMGCALILLNNFRDGVIPSKSKITIHLFLIFTIIVGAVSLLQYIFNFNAGIDEFLFREPILSVDTSNAGRMAPSTAMCFILMGFSLLFIDQKKVLFFISQFFCLLSGTIAFIPMMGYLFKAGSTNFIMNLTTMAFHTATAFFLLSFATLASRPGRGIMKPISGNTLGGRLFRMLVPLFFIFLIGITWFEFSQDGITHPENNFLHVFYLLILIYGCNTILWIVATYFVKSERKARHSEMNLQALFDNTLTGFILLDKEFNILSFNEQGNKLSLLPKGKSMEKGENILNIIPQERRANFKDRCSKVLHGEKVHYEVSQITENGMLNCLDINAIPVLDSNGEVKAISLALLNISERKIVETELLKLHKAIDTSGEVIFVTDREGIFTFINPAFTKLYGYSEEEIIRKVTPRILKSGLWGNEIYENFWNAILDGKEVRGELKNKNKAGRLIDIESTTNAIYDDKNNIIGFLGIQCDITERKKAEEEIEKSHIKNKLILDVAGEGIFGIDMAGKHTLVNQMAANVLGYKPEEMIQVHSHTLFHHHRKDGAVYPPHECPIYATLHDGIGHHGEEYFWKKDGSCFPVEFSSLPVIENGKVTGAVVTFKDITERKKAEEEIKASEERYRAVSQSANEAIISSDSKGIIVGWNNGAYNIFGYSESEILGKELKLLIPEMHHQSHHLGMRKIDENINTFINKTLEVNGVNKNGHKFPIELSISHWTTHEGVFFTGIIRDITERKKAEEKLQNQNKKLLEIASMQSHQVRAPIASILGLISLLNFDEPQDPVNAEVLNKLHSTTLNFDAVISKIVTMTGEIKEEV